MNRPPFTRQIDDLDLLAIGLRETVPVGIDTIISLMPQDRQRRTVLEAMIGHPLDPTTALYLGYTDLDAARASLEALCSLSSIEAGIDFIVFQRTGPSFTITKALDNTIGAHIRAMPITA